MPSPPRHPRLAELAERHRRLAAALADVGFTLQGSIVRRELTCSSPGCHCHNDPPQLHGPYWQWSTAIQGKSVSRNLSPEVARTYQHWIDNRKRAEALLHEMKQVAAEAADIARQQASATERQ